LKSMASRTAPSSNYPPELGGDWQNASAGFSSPSHVVPSGGYEDPPPMGSALGTTRAAVPGPDTNVKAVNFGERFQNVDTLTCLTVICACSLIILIQAAVECTKEHSKSCEAEYGWTVAAGLISFLLSILSLIWHGFSPSTYKTAQPFFAIFFVVWWIFGTGVSTFKAPFNETGNGYFAAWACFITAFLLAGSSIQRVGRCLGSAAQVIAGSIEAQLEMGILAASVVLIFAVAVEASYETATGAEVWGVICGLVSTFLIIAHKMLRSCCEQCTFKPWIIGALLSFWWLCGVAALTFDEPFESGGNGYFACWTCFVLAIWLTIEGYDGYDEIGYGRPAKPPAPTGIPDDRRMSYDSSHMSARQVS